MRIVKTTTQPDFQALFFDYFGSKPRRHRYELRFGTSNLFHDVVFLSSLVHDARFVMNGVLRQKDRVRIQIQRDTWEVGTLVRENAAELHYCKSELKFNGVASVEWRFTGNVAAEKDELWIHDLRLRQLSQPEDSFEILISGENWGVSFVLGEDNAAVMLQDKELPISHAIPIDTNG
jgi:hypothetical protein